MKKQTKETKQTAPKQVAPLPQPTIAEQIKQSQANIDAIFNHFDINEKELNKSALKKHEKTMDKLFDTFNEVHGPVFMSDVYGVMYQGVAIAQEMLDLMSSIESIPEIRIQGNQFIEMRKNIEEYMETIGVKPEQTSVGQCDCPDHVKEREVKRQGLH